MFQACNQGLGAGGQPRPSAKGPLSQMKESIFEHAIKLKSFRLTQSLLSNQVDQWYTGTALAQA